MKLERVLIVTENASMRMGGEASLPLYYFKLMRSCGIQVFMICHERVREELETTLPRDALQDIYFVNDTPLQKALFTVSHAFPARVQDLGFGQAIRLLTQVRIRTIAKRLIQELNLQIIFEPSPITPKSPSFLYDMGVPVVIGPMCGGLEFPPAFQYMDSQLSKLFVRMGRTVSNLLNRLIPGKLKADALLVANPRTAAVLPTGYQGRVYEVIESGVDLDIWTPVAPENAQNEGAGDRTPDAPVRFIFSGRFVDWKGVQFLLEAFQQVTSQCNAVLELVGDGKLRPELEAYVRSAGLTNAVTFHGWKSRSEGAALVRECDVFVMPSLRECGGTAILEAMAIGLPIVATDWAGPGIYVSPDCGFKIAPTSREDFTDGLAAAMVSLATSPELRQRMGQAAQQRVKTQYFDWDSKVSRIIDILNATLVATEAPHLLVEPEMTPIH